MKYREYGKGNAGTIILLHGGGLSWWNYRKQAEILQHDFHVVLPILDGHADSDTHFTTIENNAVEIISFIQDYFNGSVFCIGGLSLGGQIVLEILSRHGTICQHALIESAMVIPSKVTHALIKSAIDCSYPLIRRTWFSKMQFKSLHIKDDLFADYYRDTCSVAKKDMIAFLQANTSYSLKPSIKNCSASVHLYVGQKENDKIKQSAQMINTAVPHSALCELPGLYHGEFSLNYAEDYAKVLQSLLLPY